MTVFPMPNPPAPNEDIEHLYHHNAIRHLDNITEDFHRRLREKLKSQGYKGLKSSLATIMSHISFSGTRLVDIAHKRGMTKQAVGQLANEIEALGYIKRIPDPHDGRAKNLVFTESGTQLIHDYTAAVKEIENEYSLMLGEEKCKALIDLLLELSTVLQIEKQK